MDGRAADEKPEFLLCAFLCYLIYFLWEGSFIMSDSFCF